MEKKQNKLTAKAVAGAHCIYVVWRVGFLHGGSICGGVRTDASRGTKEEEVRAECGGFSGLPAILAAFTCCLKSNNSLFAARPRGPCSRLPFFPICDKVYYKEKVWEKPWCMWGVWVDFNICRPVFPPLNVSVCCFLLQTPWRWKRQPQLSGAVQTKV